MQRNKKEIKLKRVLEFRAQATIKAAAKEKMQSFYFQIKDVDLIAKELQYHQPCYNAFTKGYSNSFREESVMSSGSSSTTTTSEPTSENEVQQQGDYESVRQYINDHVLKEKNAVSMKVLHNIYDLNVGDSRYRAKLKKRIKDDFKKKVTFLSVENNLPDILIDSTLPADEVAFHDKSGCIIQAAEYLRADILTHCESLPKLSWPPTMEQLSQDEHSQPPSLQLFLKYLMNCHHSNKKPTEAMNRKITSYASDLISAVSKGKTITAKHFLLALGLHNMTGQRSAIEILNRLGHCLDYNTTCEIESAQAIKAQKLSQNSLSLPLLPINRSIPRPPIKVSLFAPPRRVSFPLKPFNRSLPSKPMRILLPEFPVIRLFKLLPVPLRFNLN